MTTSRRRSNQLGFTLLELLVVMTIAALSLAFVAPNLARNTPAEPEASARSIATGLRRTRSQAITSNRPAAMVFDLESRQWSAPGIFNAKRIAPDIDVELWTAESLRSSLRTGVVKFFPDGSSSGGRVTLSNGVRVIAVDIDWFSGRIRVVELAAPDADSTS